MKRIFLSALMVSIIGFATAAAQTITPFQKGDRVAIVGNSITDGGHYHSYIWLYYMTHFPYSELQIFNCGVGGDTSEHILKRLDDDVFAKNPTVLTLTFGMNDSGYFEYNGDNPQTFADQRVAFAKKNFAKIQERLKGLDDTRIVMIGTSPYDEMAQIDNTPFKRKNEAIKRIIELQKEAAWQNKWEFLDFNAPMTAINSTGQQKNPAFTLCGSDRIHPDNNGHMVMAYLFLKAQGMVGKKVADISIDAKAGKAIFTENCLISNVKKNGRVLSFDYLANSLPYPLDTIARGWNMKFPQSDIKQIIPSFMSEMNMEQLSVSGLKGQYQLLIDDEPIAVFTAESLARGINLAECVNTPQYQQALTIMALNEERWEIERRFRDYAWLQYNFFLKHGLLNVNNQKAVKILSEKGMSDGWVRSKADLYGKMIHKDVRDAYWAEIKLLTDRIYEINKPVMHRVTLTPI